MESSSCAMATLTLIHLGCVWCSVKHFWEEKKKSMFGVFAWLKINLKPKMFLLDPKKKKNVVLTWESL